MNSYRVENDIAFIEFNDGKANVFSSAASQHLSKALTRAEEEASATVLIGSNSQFSAGFDLKVMQSGDLRAMTEMLLAGFQVLNQLALHPHPTIAACNGNALGLGAFLLLACDTRLAIDQESKIGLPETAASMHFTKNLLAVAKHRINPSHYVRAALQSELFDPHQAQLAGFIDHVLPASEFEQAVTAKATQLSQLPAKFYARNKRDLLAGLHDELKMSLQAIIADPAKHLV